MEKQLVSFNRRDFLLGVSLSAAAALGVRSAKAAPDVKGAPAPGCARRTWGERLAGKEMLFIAHRGCQSLAPENTIPSFVCAARLGLQAIETDVRLSKDGVMVCSHDDSLKRMFGLKKKVSELTYAELKSLVPVKGNGLAVWPKKALRVPTFGEYLDVCERYDAVPFIETKGDVAVVKPVLDELAAMGNAGLSYNYKDLSAVPDGLVAGVHAKGVKMCLRAGDTPEAVERMTALGLDYIPTNVTVPLKPLDCL